MVRWVPVSGWSYSVSLSVARRVNRHFAMGESPACTVAFFPPNETINGKDRRRIIEAIPNSRHPVRAPKHQLRFRCTPSRLTVCPKLTKVGSIRECNLLAVLNFGQIGHEREWHVGKAGPTIRAALRDSASPAKLSRPFLVLEIVTRRAKNLPGRRQRV